MGTRSAANDIPLGARRMAVSVLTVLLPGAAFAADGADGSLRPHRLTLLHGAASDARATSVGLQWDLPWRRAWGRRGTLTAHAEFALGHWRADAGGDRSSAVSTQVGLTPVLRYTFAGAAGWFVEAGVGANLIAPVYRSKDRRFSTAFNFGDHVGVGWRSSARPGWEWALRVQHFSNAGIARPNPGENFVQLQLAYELR
ncbi:acyloxyacyl hydrolase [Betaproteobacteria bacterium PRO7]|nr:acyloxyacyl hydrolase [Betaproteobacteria bacterium PRO7]